MLESAPKDLWKPGNDQMQQRVALRQVVHADGQPIRLGTL